MISKINFTDVNPISNRETSLIKKDLYYTIKNKDFILGKNVKRFENNFSKLSKIKYSIGCASGTDALILALKSLNIKKNDYSKIPNVAFKNKGSKICVINYEKINFSLSCLNFCR